MTTSKRRLAEFKSGTPGVVLARTESNEAAVLPISEIPVESMLPLMCQTQHPFPLTNTFSEGTWWSPHLSFGEQLLERDVQKNVSS